MNVLVWGDSAGPCAYYRGSMFRDYLATKGVTLRQADVHTIIRVLDADGHEMPGRLPQDELLKGMNSGKYRLDAEVDTEPVEWADVILFRRDYNTNFSCSLDPSVCAFRTEDIRQAVAHPHKLIAKRDTATLPIWKGLIQTTDDRPAIVYDTDDYLIAERKMLWNGLWPDYWAHRELCREMAREADLVTVTTPTLASFYRHTNANIRVVRNAIDPEIYYTEAPRPERERPLMLYYGSAVRMRDFGGYPDDQGKIRGGYAFKAVMDLKKELSTLFLGCEPGYEPKVRSFYFDKVQNRVEGIQLFAMSLASTHADIGIAPLWGDEFDAAKSELHWLEYAAVGAAVVAERMDGKGPYSVIRDGVDGLLVRGRQDWYDALRRLIRNPNLRADIAAAARERVLAEYDYRVRAQEWIDAFQWAIENKRPMRQIA